MTVNELEQGIRNLIATQPMVLSGVNGEIVNNVLSIIDAYRSFNFRVQSYPCQDVLKFSLSNESAKMENNLSSLVCQVLQERGINLMLYIPQQSQFGPMINNYGMINQRPNQPMMMGQMMYQMPQPQAPMGASMMQMPHSMQMGNSPAFNQMNAPMQGIGMQNRPRRKTAPTFPGYEPANRPVRLEPSQTATNPLKTRSADPSKINTIPKAATAEVNQVNKIPVAMPEEPTIPVAQPSPAEMMMGGGASGEKAAGRDYLMELLKK